VLLEIESKASNLPLSPSPDFAFFVFKFKSSIIQMGTQEAKPGNYTSETSGIFA
jgi:hypothetical protein